SREPLMYAGGLPYEHPFAALKAVPQRALYPRPIRNPARAGMWFWLTLPLRGPLLLARSVRAAFRMQALSRTFAPRFRAELVPALAAGRTGRAAFRRQFGHRGPQEMELSQPRWAEDDAALGRLAAAPAAEAPPPADWKATWERVATEARLSALQRTVLTGELE